MMSPFFRLLPADLQIDILYVWLNSKDSGKGLLRVLSAIDMACCSKAVRKPFLWLIAQIPAFGELTPVESVSSVIHIFPFVQWLDSRKVVLKVLALNGRQSGGTDLFQGNEGHAISFPAVEHIHWVESGIYGQTLEGVLRCCPNLTSIVCERFQRYDVTNTDLVEKYVPYLRDVTVLGCLMVSVDHVCCPQLRVLRLKGYLVSSFADAAIAGCPLLETLEVMVDTRSFNSVSGIVRACPLLRELILHGDGRGESIEVQILQIATHKQIQRLAFLFLNDFLAYGRQYDETFVRILELRPDIEHLQVNSRIFSRTAGDVLHVNIADHQMYQLCQGFLSPQILARILGICAPFKLNLTINISDDVVNAMRAANLDLQSLTANDWYMCRTLLLRELFNKESLLQLEMQGEIYDGMLSVVEHHCPKLKSLSLTGSLHVTDEGMIGVFKRCKKIEHLKMIRISSHKMTRKTVQGMFDCGLHLKTLKLPYFEGCSAEWLRQQAKECQLLPVPDVEMQACK